MTILAKLVKSSQGQFNSRNFKKMSYYKNTFIYIFKIQKKTVHISINKHSHRAQTTCLGPIRRHCVPHVITMMAVPAINDSVEKKM